MGSSLRPRAARLMSPHPHAELGLAGLHEEMRPSDLTSLLPPEPGCNVRTVRIVRELAGAQQ